MKIEEPFSYNNFDYSINISKLLDTPDGDIDVLLKFYNISPDTLDTMINSIRDWYDKQPHLPRGQLHTRMIFGQLIARGFRVEQTKEHIDNYFSARHKMPEILCGWDPLPENMQKYVKEGYWIVPPRRTADNQRILMFRIVNPSELVMLDLIRVGFLLRDYRIFNETALGEHWILDVSNATLSNVMQFTPVLLSKIYYYITSCYAPKLKGIHLVNVPSYGSSIITLLKKVMKPKHVERLHVHEKFEKIFDVFPKDLFPKDLGGTADMTSQDIADNMYELLQTDTWKGFIKHQEKHFITDESKRNAPQKFNILFGADGSFRKLELD